MYQSARRWRLVFAVALLLLTRLTLGDDLAVTKFPEGTHPEHVVSSPSESPTPASSTAPPEGKSEAEPADAPSSLSPSPTEQSPRLAEEHPSIEPLEHRVEGNAADAPKSAASSSSADPELLDLHLQGVDLGT